MSPHDPAAQLLGWAATRAAEAIVAPIADRIVRKAKARAVATVKQRASRMVEAVRRRGR